MVKGTETSVLFKVIRRIERGGELLVHQSLNAVIVKREQIFSAHIRERRHSVNRTEHPAGYTGVLAQRFGFSWSYELRQ